VFLIIISEERLRHWLGVFQEINQWLTDLRPPSICGCSFSYIYFVHFYNLVTELNQTDCVFCQFQKLI